jgi:hypothetical protein
VTSEFGMRWLRIVARRALDVMWLVVAGGITANTSAAQSQPTQTVVALIGDAACDDDSQCNTIPVGEKACGGPEYYLAWSTKRTDAAALRAAAATPTARPIVNPRAQSTCIVVTDPGAFCAPAIARAGDTARAQGGVCRLRGGGRGTPGRVD